MHTQSSAAIRREAVAFVALGSNLGDRAETFMRVLDAIDACSELELEAASPIFETPAIGPGNQGPYLNAVLRLRTSLAPRPLFSWLQDVECALGRDRSGAAVRWGPRTIDLDLIFYDDVLIDEPDLVIPHPRAHERSFVLEPMRMLAGDFEHPGLGVTIEALADALIRSGTERAAQTEVVEGDLRIWPPPSGWPLLE